MSAFTLIKPKSPSKLMLVFVVLMLSISPKQGKLFEVVKFELIFKPVYSTEIGSVFLLLANNLTCVSLFNNTLNSIYQLLKSCVNDIRTDSINDSMFIFCTYNAELRGQARCLLGPSVCSFFAHTA